jgi:3-oxoacyl-[acyl-carrier-protein] synthase II
MAFQRDIVITGMGVVSPIGIGVDALAASLAAGRSGIRRLNVEFDDDQLAFPIGAEVLDFDPKLYVRPRKSLKVMSRDIQLAFTAADLACADAGLREHPVDPERLGIVFGSDLIPCDLDEIAPAYRSCTTDGRFDFQGWGPAFMADLFPLWMLKYLPNMPACHIGIAQDARGPNNSLTLGDASSLSAVAEAVRVIQRGWADAMIAGGGGSRIHPTLLMGNRAYDPTSRGADPAALCRPFDANRRLKVYGEGAGAYIIETRRHAEARGAAIQATVAGYAATFEPSRNRHPLQGRGIRQAISGSLRNAGLSAADIGHVNANGLGTVNDDRIEAQAIRALLGDVPVTAPKSYFGCLGAGAGAIEMAVSMLAIRHGMIAPTLNYENPDPECPINVVVDRQTPVEKPYAMLLNHTSLGQAVAMILGPPG